MPGMSGIEATMEIKKVSPSQQPRAIIGVTADVVTDTHQKCIEAGMQDYITKPVQHDLLKQKLDKYFL